MPIDEYLELVEATSEFAERLRRGEVPEVEEYVRRYPSLAPRIRELFPALLLLQSSSGSRRQARGDMTPSMGVDFGPYRIVRELGRGGMGIVYEAEHQVLHKRVALKTLPTRVASDAEQLERFFREARTAAGLHHTNIVPVFDVGQVDGTPYFAMQYIEGRSLEHLLRAVRSLPAPALAAGASCESAPTATSAVELPFSGSVGARSGSSSSSRLRDPSVRKLAGLPERLHEYFRWVARIGLQAADGLAYAHDRGIVHRDIKPSNLILDPQGTVWITDFGLARRAEDPALTQTGTVLGTPRYMSPEQVDGKRQPDARSDVYSLGATLYELLSGEPVYDGASAQEIFLRIATRDPEPLHRLNPQVPRDLETVVAKAMARRPEDRYQSSRLLAEDLRRWLRLEPILARPLGPVGRTLRWCRRNPTLAAVTFASAAVILALSGVYYVRLLEENARTRAALEQATHSAEAARRAADEAETERRRADGQRLEAETRREEALRLRGIAEAERSRAEHQRAATRRILYGAEMRLAFQAWDAADYDQVQELTRRQIPGPGQEDLRGFEWQYLTRAVRRGQLIRFRNPAAVMSMVYTPDGRRLIAGDAAGFVRVYDPESGAEERAFKAHPRLARIVSVLPDGATIVTFGSDTVKFWDFSGVEKPSPRIPQFAASIRASPDGKLLGGFQAREGTVWVWDIAHGREIGSVKGRLIAFSPDGREAATADNRSVTVWERATLRMLRSWTAPNQVTLLEYSPDGTVLAAAMSDGAIRVYDPRSGAELGALHGHNRTVAGLAFSSDSRRIVSASFDRTVRMWDLGTWTEIGMLKGHSDVIWALALRPDGRHVATAGGDLTTVIWDAAASDQDVIRAGRSLTSVAVSPDGALLAAGGSDRSVTLWGRDDGRLIRVLEGHSLPLMSVAFSPDGRKLASGGVDDTVRIWDVEAGRSLLVLTGHRGDVYGVSFSPDGRLVASASTDRTVRLWDAASGETIRVLNGHTFPVMAVAFTPDGRRVVTASDDRTLKVWDAASGAEVRTLAGHGNSVWCVAVSPDGRLIASGSFDRSVRAWELLTGRLVGTYKAHSNNVAAVVFSGDGRRLISASDDRTIRFWDLGSGEQVGALLAHSGNIRSMALSRDGKTLVSAGDDRTIRLWRAEERRENSDGQRR